MKISSSDKAILRKLAEQVAAIAALPSHKATIAGWKRLNGLGHCKPMIRINEVPWHEMDVDGKLTLLCSDALCRIQEEHSAAIFAEDRWQPERARRALREFLEQSRGCIVEIIMKDISTVRYQPRRLWQWAALASDIAEGFAS